jgi:mannosyltransferase OCH1-like enzyme
MSTQPHAWPLFLRFEGIQRVDLFRYFVLHDFGGIYCDLDIMLVRPITEALDSSPLHIGLVPSANTSGVYTNAFMISDDSAVAKAFWVSVMRHVHEFPKGYAEIASLGLRHTEIMASTGPLALTKCAAAFDGPITVLPKELWNPYELSVAGNEYEQLHPKSLVRILKGSSWHELDSSFFSFVHTHRKYVALLVMLGVLYFVINANIVRQKFASLRRAFRKQNK